MIIGFDATHFTGVSGIETYARNLVRAMAQSFPDDRIVLFTTRNKSDEVAAIVNDCPNIRVDGSLLHPLALGGAGVGIVQWLRRRTWRRVARTCDVVHFPDPLHFVSGIPNAVVTVHDIIPAYPEPWGASQTSQEQVTVLRTIARGTAQIIVPSEFVKSEIDRVFGVAAARVHVVHEAANATFTPDAAHNVRPRVLREGQERYLLCVGRLDPRKNLVRTIDAFADASRNDAQLHLVIAGRGSETVTRALIERAQRGNVGDRVIFIDNASDGDLIDLYRSAIALVFVSLSEGFGLPAIEAMQCGCPVIASRSSSLPEIVGAGGIHVDPLDVPAITAAMRTMCADRQARASYQAAALAQSRTFAWERAADETHGAFGAATR